MASFQTVTFASGAVLSDESNLSFCTLAGVIMPAAWNTANLTFQGGQVSGSLSNLYDEYGTEVNVTAAASRYIAVSPEAFVGVTYLKLRSGTVGATVAQTAARIVTLVTIPALG